MEAVFSLEESAKYRTRVESLLCSGAQSTVLSLSLVDELSAKEFDIVKVLICLELNNYNSGSCGSIYTMVSPTHSPYNDFYWLIIKITLSIRINRLKHFTSNINKT